MWRVFLHFADRLTISYSRSSGPGGQNVNKGTSAVCFRLLAEGPAPRAPLCLHFWGIKGAFSSYGNTTGL